MSAKKSNGKKKIEVEQGVPLPPKARPTKYPDLEVGESFFVPNGKHSTVAGVIAHRARRFKQQHTCRSVKEGRVKGLRVWRKK